MKYLLNKRLKKRSKMYKARGLWGVTCILFLGIITGLGMTGDRAHAETIKSDNNDVLTGTVNNNETEKTSFSGEDEASTDSQSPTTNEMASEKLETEVNQPANNTQDVNTTGSSTYEQVEPANPQESQPSLAPSINSPKETKVVKDDEVKYSQPTVAVERQENGYWYLYNPQTNTKYTGFQTLKDGRVVYYNDQGQMQYGEQNIDHHWYLFDQWTGAMKNGFQYIPKYKKTVYYNANGQMQFGWQVINGKQYYLDRGTGAVTKGQKKLGGSWFHFDENTGAMSTGFTYLNDAHKLVYYSEDKNTIGRMQYGQQKINGHWYLFDKVSGAMKTGFQYIAEQKKIVYYAGNGQMVYGWQNMYGNRYFFDRESGAQAKSEILRIDGHYYAFDGRGNAHDFNELNSLINRLGSNISVAIQSQRSGQIYTYSNAGNRRYSTASTVKAAVLAELLHNRGGNLTAEERHLAEIMIRNSDNGATTNLIRYHLGEAGSPVNRLYRDLEMRNTTPSSSWGATQTTPADQLKLLYQIFMTDHSSYLNRKSQDYIRHLMHTVSAGQRWGISAGSSDYYLKNGWVPFGWNGNDPWFVNSIGFIPNNGHGYTIAIYSANNPFSQGINKIEQVARKVSQMLK